MVVTKKNYILHFVKLSCRGVTETFETEAFTFAMNKSYSLRGVINHMKARQSDLVDSTSLLCSSLLRPFCILSECVVNCPSTLYFPHLVLCLMDIEVSSLLIIRLRV